MVFSSTEFLLLFLPVVLILYNISKNIKYRNVILLAASLFFYAWGEPVFVFLMLFSVLINYFIGLIIGKSENRKKQKLVLITGLIFNIIILFVFKYLGFACNIFNAVFNTELSVQITLPIGISFFTFQIMSYIFDVYYKKAEVQKNYFNLLLYVSMFPQLIAGPIVRYQTIADEISSRTVTKEDFTKGITRFVYGLAKKIVISNYVALIADNIFTSDFGDMSVMTAWLGAFAYTLQIYFDFSGYSDMAIGLGLLFGFHFDENFNYPYAASSITDFWRRWHISLSTWFRDYLYIPLGGNRVSAKRHFLNMLVVWLFTGIWHGANFTFIIWGLAYFVLLCIEKYAGFTKKIGWFSHIYTMFFVVLLWVLFRAESVTQAFEYIKIMFGGGYTFADKFFIYYIDSGKWVLIIGALLSVPVLKKIYNAVISKAIKKPEAEKAVRTLVDAGEGLLVLALFALCVILCVNFKYNPFIYFNF